VLLALARKARGRRDFAAATARAEQAILVAVRRRGRTVEAADELADMFREQGDDAKARGLFQRLNLVERILPPGAADPGGPSVERLPDGPRCSPPKDAQPPSVSNVSSVVAGMAADFRRCYNQALREDPNFQGSIRIRAKIASAGDVTFVRTLVPASYPERMILCLMDRVFRARFAPPQGGGATIIIPVTFTTQ
jgi:hypothetical protein